MREQFDTGVTFGVTGGRLRSLPASVRLMITAFLAIIGSGYVVALVNIYYSHRMADGRAGLSMDDIRAVYSGLLVPAGGAGGEIPSRMLTMLRGEMRQYVSSDENFAVLETWLTSGAAEDDLDRTIGGATPRRVVIRDCLRCHARSTGTDISKKSPFGPDEFEVDYALLAPVLPAAEGPATGAGHGTVDDTGSLVRVAPQYTVPRLILVSHQHMLAIPVFTLIVGLLFAMTRLPRGIRAVLTPLPMLATAVDFSGWFLARVADGFIVFIAGAGAVFGLVLGVQILSVAADLWMPNRDDQNGSLEEG